MSIIYDALKKVQKSNNVKTETPANAPSSLLPSTATAQNKPAVMPKKGTSTPFLLVILFVVAGVALIYFFPSLAKNFQQAKPKEPATKPAALKQEEPVKPVPVPEVKDTALPEVKNTPPLPVVNKEIDASAFVLNGVFASEKESYALINNQIVRVGAKIEGATVKRIENNEVELELNGESLKLTTSGK